MSTPTAAWDTRDLYGSLCRSGWQSDLDARAGQGLRSVLRALVELLPYGSGEGKATAAQVADAAGLSVRWTRRCLHVLEDMGLISWRRGSIVDGRPRPGWVRIIKTNLARLARRARGYLDDRRTRRQDAARERLKGLRCSYVRNTGRRNPLSVRAELSAALPFPKGGTALGSLPYAPALLTPEGEPMTQTRRDTPCQVCGKIAELCESAARKVPKALRHEYEPSEGTHRRLIAPLPDRHRPIRGQHPAGWRHEGRQQPLIGDTDGH